MAAPKAEWALRQHPALAPPAAPDPAGRQVSDRAKIAAEVKRPLPLQQVTG